MKKIIVTGSTGFIGSAFVEHLIKNNIEVLALGRKNLNDLDEIKQQRLKGAKYLKLEMSRISKLKEALSAIGWHTGDNCVFFNLAWGGKNGLSDMDIEAQLNNVIWTASALEAAKEVGCNCFIQVGTMEEAFTQRYLELDYHSDTQYNRHVIYSVAKLIAKNAVVIKASELNMDYIYVKHSHVMGPYDDKNSFLQVTLQKIIYGEELIFSSGEQYFDVISLHDCSLGYFLACQRGRSNTEYWVGSGEPKRLKEYIERMHKLFPSDTEMQFGKLPYNDIVLDKSVFSISNLTDDTGYKPISTYEQIVNELYDYLVMHPQICKYD